MEDQILELMEQRQHELMRLNVMEMHDYQRSSIILNELKSLQVTLEYLRQCHNRDRVDLEDIARQLESSALKMEETNSIRTKPIARPHCRINPEKMPNIEIAMLMAERLEEDERLDDRLKMYNRVDFITPKPSMNDILDEYDYGSVPEEAFDSDLDGLSEIERMEWVHQVFEKCRKYLNEKDE